METLTRETMEKAIDKISQPPITEKEAREIIEKFKETYPRCEEVLKHIRAQDHLAETLHLKRAIIFLFNQNSYYVRLSSLPMNKKKREMDRLTKEFEQRFGRFISPEELELL